MGNFLKKKISRGKRSSKGEEYHSSLNIISIKRFTYQQNKVEDEPDENQLL